MKIAGILKNIFLFSELSEVELKKISELSSLKRLKKNETLFEESETANYLYAVAHGTLKVYQIKEDGSENIIHVQGAGDLIAEAVLFGIKKYPASCNALKDALVVCVPKLGFIEAILKEPKLAIKLMSAYSKRLRDFVDKLDGLTKSLEERLFTFLVSQKKSTGSRASFELILSRKEIAGFLGASPEAISRAFTSLKKKKLIDYGPGRNITIF